MKTPDKDQIKKVFASKLSGLEQDPPTFMWEKIEAGLVDQGLKTQSRPLRYKIAGWASIAAAAAIILGLFVFLPQKENPESNQVAKVEPVLKLENADSGSVIENTVEKNIEKDYSADIEHKKQKSEHVLLAQANKDVKTENRLNDAVVSDNIKADPNKKSDEISSSQPTNIQVFAASMPVVKAEEPKTGQPPKSNNDLQKQIEAFEAEGHKSEKLLADNNNKEIKSNTSSNKGLDLGVNGGGAFSKADGYKRTVLAMANTDQQLSLRSETVKLEHNQPINFGLSVNKRINDRLSIESGITYTYLSSKIRSKSASAYSQNNSQYFHYLGIPLTLNYNVVEWNRVRLYISAGGAIQKDIYGRLDRNGGISQAKSSNNASISQKNAQMSLTSSIGISYPIYGNMSLYTTVGGAYYIDAKNDYETIFSDKKWLLNLNLGVKFGF